MDAISRVFSSPLWTGAAFAGAAAWVRCRLKKHMRVWACIGEAAGCALLGTMLTEVVRIVFPSAPEDIAIACSIFAGWIGTDGIMVMFMRIFNARFPKKASSNKTDEGRG